MRYSHRYSCGYTLIYNCCCRWSCSKCLAPPQLVLHLLLLLRLLSLLLVLSLLGYLIFVPPLCVPPPHCDPPGFALPRFHSPRLLLPCSHTAPLITPLFVPLHLLSSSCPHSPGGASFVAECGSRHSRSSFSLLLPQSALSSISSFPKFQRQPPLLPIAGSKFASAPQFF